MSRQLTLDGEYLKEAETPDKRYKDPEWLQEQYHGEKQSTREIAAGCGVGQMTVIRWMDKHGISRRTRGEGKRMAEFGNPVSRFVRSDGYIEAQASCGGEVDHVAMHRLLAVSEYGFDALDGKHVHHKNHIPWDNRPDNIELMTPSEHQSYHRREGRSP